MIDRPIDLNFAYLVEMQQPQQLASAIDSPTSWVAMDVNYSDAGVVMHLVEKVVDHRVICRKMNDD